MKSKIGILLSLLIWLSACKKDEVKTNPPVASNVEIGLDNSKRAFVGQDFHLNAEITAAGRIQTVEVKILQKSNQTYSASWKFELSFPEFKGIRNPKIHKHFDIPSNAPKGLYDFLLVVNDENGGKLEVKAELTIMDVNDLPVNPQITILGGVADNQQFKKGDNIQVNAKVSGIKDNGKAYVLLLKNRLNHHPEGISTIDFSKAIVIQELDHNGLAANSTITLADGMVVGSASDNKKPSGSPINGDRAWESGQYTLTILYNNTSHQLSVFKSIPISINYN